MNEGTRKFLQITPSAGRLGPAVRLDPQVLPHQRLGVAIAGRHLIDELLERWDTVQFSLGINFVFEAGFTNLQFVGLSAMAQLTGDRMFEKMVQKHPDGRGAPCADGRPLRCAC